MKFPSIISITNLKGGVGKTTFCIHFAYLFAKLGKKILLVDLDPQGNLSSYYTDNFEETHHIKLIFEKAFPVPFEVKENLYILPSNIELSKHELQIKLESYFRLRDFVKTPEIRDFFDIILVDTSSFS